MFILKLIFGALFNLVLFAVLLFVPAGTLAWERGWAFIGVLFLGMVASIAGLLPGHRELLKERVKPFIQRGQPLADKLILVPFILMFYGLIVFIPLDVFRFQLLPRPGALVAVLGLVLFIAGWWVITLAMAENTFAAPVIKHQAERGQTVVDTGVYSVVRHPMYSGSILVMLGMPLWLGSYAATLLALVPIATLALRILIEEEFLRRELKGYDAYMTRVRRRLIPYVW